MKPPGTRGSTVMANHAVFAQARGVHAGLRRHDEATLPMRDR
nr:hypothetical protein [uncultured Rhodopila sp.]